MTATAHTSHEADLRAPQHAAVIQILNLLLADEYVLYVKTRNYHWNVTGPGFYGLHRLFEEQYERIAKVFDDIAERTRALGGRPLPGMRQFLQESRLSEATVGGNLTDQEMIEDLLTDYEQIVRSLRADARICAELYRDQATADFLSSLQFEHEKTAWMLRSLLVQSAGSATGPKSG